MIASAMDDACRYLLAGIGPGNGDGGAFLAAPANAVVIQTLDSEIQFCASGKGDRFFWLWLAVGRLFHDILAE